MMDKWDAGMPKGYRLPVYMRIGQVLRDAIEKGVYRQGDQLPAEIELARRFGTTRSTVAHALQNLVYEGIIERRQGKGTFVAQKKYEPEYDSPSFSFFERHILGSGLSLAYALLDFEKTPPMSRANSALQLPHDEPLFRLRRLRVVDGTPLAFETRYMSCLTAVRINNEWLRDMALQDIFIMKLGIRLVRCPTIMRVALAGSEAARHLRIERSRPVFINEHQFLNEDGKPEFWGETVYTEAMHLRFTRAITPSGEQSQTPEMHMD